MSRLSKARIYVVELPYKEPFRIAGHTSTYTKNVVLELVDEDGVKGIGESSPSYRVMGDSVEKVITTIEEFLSHYKENKFDVSYLELVHEVLNDRVYPKSAGASCAIESAILDLHAKSLSLPLYRALGAYRDYVESDITIGIEAPEVAARRALAFAEMGFKVLKIKVGEDPADDIERVRAVREALGGDVTIRVDANQGWSVKTAIKTIRELEKLDVELVEQPIDASNIEGLKEIKKNVSVPIAVDESVKSYRDAAIIAKEGAADILNIKLAKCGGVLNARVIARVAEANGLSCMIGCGGESGIGISAALHFALSAKNVKYVDLDSDLLLAKRIEEPETPLTEGGRRLPSNLPGLGIKELKMELLGAPVAVYEL